MLISVRVFVTGTEMTLGQTVSPDLAKAGTKKQYKKREKRKCKETVL